MEDSGRWACGCFRRPGLVSDEQFEVSGNQTHGRVAALFSLRKAFEDEVFEGRGDADVVKSKAGGINGGVDLHAFAVFGGDAFEGFVSGEHFVAGDAEGVDVGLVVEEVFGEGFRGEVGEGPGEGVHLDGFAFVGGGEVEVDEDDESVGADEDVFRFDVKVEVPVEVDVGECGGELAHEGEDVLLDEGGALEDEFAEVGGFDVFEDHEGFFMVVSGFDESDEVGVVEFGEDFGAVEEEVPGAPVFDVVLFESPDDDAVLLVVDSDVKVGHAAAGESANN